MNQQSLAIWSAKQERLALLLASGWAIKAAAREIRIGERTAHTWLEDPGYRAMIADLRGRMLEVTLGKLAEAAGSAVDELRNLLNDQSGNVRLRAALGILDSLVKYREQVELDQRLTTLEQRIKDE